jgi:hypothetical protein
MLSKPLINIYRLPDINFPIFRVCYFVYSYHSLMKNPPANSASIGIADYTVRLDD